MQLSADYTLKLYETLLAQGFKTYYKSGHYGYHVYFSENPENVKNHNFVPKDKWLNMIGSGVHSLYYEGNKSEEEIRLFHVSCYLDFWRTLDAEKRKDDGATFTKLIPQAWSEGFYLALSLTKNKQEFIDFFSGFSIRDATLGRINLNELHTLLEQKGFTDKEKDKFFLSFIKQRKNQTKDTHVSTNAKDFLISYYQDVEQLKAFFPYFPLLKGQFEEVAHDFEEESYSLTTSLFVNLKKMVTSFPREKTGPREMHSHLCYLARALSETYGGTYRVYEETTNALSRVVLYHDNPILTQELMRQNLIDCFKMFSEHADVRVTTDLIKTFLFKKTLDKTLPDKTFTPKSRKI